EKANFEDTVAVNEKEEIGLHPLGQREESLRPSFFPYEI
ncbi:unnamed protein product, partial [marine sediment metagenome]